MTTHAAETDLLTFLTAQHREIEDMFTRLEQMDGTTGDDAQRLAEQVVMLLVKHSVAEEIYLYPASREHVPGGDEVVDHELAEHQQAEQTMKRLEQLTPTDADFWPTVHQLISEVRHHLDEEENDLFPRLAVACSVRELRELGRKVEQAEKIAPTRPHPSKPSEGAPLAALTPVAGLVDRMRDALSGRGS